MKWRDVQTNLKPHLIVGLRSGAAQVSVISPLPKTTLGLSKVSIPLGLKPKWLAYFILLLFLFFKSGVDMLRAWLGLGRCPL